MRLAQGHQRTSYSSAAFWGQAVPSPWSPSSAWRRHQLQSLPAPPGRARKDPGRTPESHCQPEPCSGQAGTSFASSHGQHNPTPQSPRSAPASCTSRVSVHTVAPLWRKGKTRRGERGSCYGRGASLSCGLLSTGHLAKCCDASAEGIHAAERAPM